MARPGRPTSQAGILTLPYASPWRVLTCLAYGTGSAAKLKCAIDKASKTIKQPLKRVPKNTSKIRPEKISANVPQVNPKATPKRAPLAPFGSPRGLLSLPLAPFRRPGALWTAPLAPCGSPRGPFSVPFGPLWTPFWLQLDPLGFHFASSGGSLGHKPLFSPKR